MADGSEDLVSRRSISTITDRFEMMDDDANTPLDNMDILNLEDTEKSAPTSRSGSSRDSSQYSYDSPGKVPDVLEESEQNDRGQLSIDGVLDEETIEQGLSNLGRSADGTQQVFLHLSIPGYRLRDISLLGEYIHLQKVEIPYNEITDLSPLSSMPYLLELNASHNQLTTLLDFKPPNNLKIVDVSYNEINEMADLSAHHYLVKLIIDNNNINEIKGIEKCTRLKQLSLAHNQIENIKGLTGLPLTYLNLSFNKLTKIENLETLKLLRTIDLSGNQIRSMNGLQDHEFLESVDLETNEIIDLAEVQYIRPLTLIRELNLQRNPIRELPDYRLSVIYYLQQLIELDRKKVEVDEKVSASNMFNPPMEVLAARDHIMHVIYSFIQPSRVLDSTLPSIDTPYPMLVLVGPQGAGKADLAQKLVEEFSDYFGYGITHTTRHPFAEERQGKDHHFVTLEEFEESIKMGRFLYTYSYHGDLYGLTLDAVETVARDGLACVVIMEIEGVLTLKNTHFEPRYVLVLPMSSDVHERRLREQGTYSEMQIQMTLARDELYANYNREHPGFFDVMIASDDIIEAYKQLRRLIMEYLGINAPSPSISDVEPSNGGSVLEKEGTMDTLTGQSNLVRQWSKLSITDSLSQAINSLKVKSAPSPMPTTGRGIVEELSLRRRESAAKQTASGHQPTIYEQLLQNAPRTVPLPVSDQVGLGEEKHEPRSYSAPMSKNENMDALPPSSPDSSLSGDGDGTSLTDISEACDMERDDPIPQEGSPKGSEEDFALPSEAVDMIDMLSASGSKNFPGSVPLAPRLGSDSCQVESPRSNASGSRSNSRLGSERHRVLPPITA